MTVQRTNDDVEIVDTGEASVDASAAYLADGSTRGGAKREIILSTELGLAIEKLPEGYTARSLWAVV